MTNEDISDFWNPSGRGKYRTEIVPYDPDEFKHPDHDQHQEWEALFEKLGLIATFPFICPESGGLDGYTFLTIHGVSYLYSQSTHVQSK